MFSLAIITKANHFFFTLIQKEQPVPARISLYQQLRDKSGRTVLKQVAQQLAEEHEFFLEVEVGAGEYCLYVEAVSTNMLRNLSRTGFNPLVSKYHHKDICDFVLGFYTR